MLQLAPAAAWDLGLQLSGPQGQLCTVVLHMAAVAVGPPHKNIKGLPMSSRGGGTASRDHRSQGERAAAGRRGVVDPASPKFSQHLSITC